MLASGEMIIISASPKKTPTAALKAALATFLAISTVLTTPLLEPSNAAPIMPPFMRQFSTAADIPASSFSQHESIYGRVIKVADGDTIRIRKFDGRMMDNTISVRLYGIDSPELGKKGNPSMPMAEEAREYTTTMVKDKVVKVKLLRKDQYGRAVGKVTVRGIIPIICTRRDVSMGLAKNGLAVLYTGGGAEYDGGRSELQSLIDTAKRRRRGMWYSGEVGVQTPAQYKQNLKLKPSVAY